MLMSKNLVRIKTKVRFVLVEKVLQNADGYSYVKSAPARIIRIYKPEVYQEFFAQLDKSIFLRRDLIYAIYCNKKRN